MRSLNTLQRVVLVVALGAALFFVGGYLTGGSHLATGWTGYAPLQSVPVVSRAGLSGVGSLVVWLALVVVWACASVAVLRTRQPTRPVDSDNRVRETGVR